PVWTVLPTRADWRWMEGREERPWYATMRRLRQTARGDWTGVVARVKEALSTWAQMGVVGGNAIRGVTLPIVPNHSQARPPASAASPSKFSAVAETRFGILQYLPDDPLEGQSIDRYGEFLQTQIDVLNKIVRPGMTVVEIGAGVGAHSLALSRAVGDDGNVIAEETRPLARRILLQNLRANRIRNVTVLPRASEPTALDSLYLDQLG